MGKAAGNAVMHDDLEFDYFGVRWTVRFVDWLEDETCSPRGVTDGVVDYGRNEIAVATRNRAGVEYGNGHVRQVLLHELLHMMVAEGQFKGAHQDEAFIEWMARALDELINTEAFKKIMELK